MIFFKERSVVLMSVFKLENLSSANTYKQSAPFVTIGDSYLDYVLSELKSTNINMQSETNTAEFIEATNFKKWIEKTGVYLGKFTFNSVATISVYDTCKLGIGDWHEPHNRYFCIANNLKDIKNVYIKTVAETIFPSRRSNDTFPKGIKDFLNTLPDSEKHWKNERYYLLFWNLFMAVLDKNIYNIYRYTT